MRLHWPLINLAALFLIPVIAAGYVVSNKYYQNLPTAQHGNFIQPVQPLTLSNVNHLAGNSHLSGWKLVYVEPELCQDDCQKQKQILLKLHTALGAARDRVSIITTLQQDLPSNIATGNLLILDPNGLFIMQYSDNIDHAGLLKDLRRLLKYSHA